MMPITRDAQPSDPRWEREFVELAHGLVMAGAKTKLIARYTGMSIRKIRNLYGLLRQMAAPAGPIVQALKSQPCPVCSMNANSRRLVEQGASAGRKSAAKRR